MFVYNVHPYYYLLSYFYISHSTSSSFFFNDTATTEIYTLSLHDALPISCGSFTVEAPRQRWFHGRAICTWNGPPRDRKSTRLNSSHRCYLVCRLLLEKKKKKKKIKNTKNRTNQK